MFKIINKVIDYLKTKNVILTIQANFSNNNILVYTFSDEKNPNFGDDLNFYLLSKIANKKIIPYWKVVLFKKRYVYSFIGSILDNIKVPNLIILGSGFMYPTSQFKIKPLKVNLIRGNLSKKIMDQQFPEIFQNVSLGDPSVLIKRYFNPEVEIKYNIGIIPHYKDFNDNNYSTIYHHLKKETNPLIINIKDPIENFIINIKSCSLIISSSLHGLIMADLYGIPSLWIEFSDMVKGDGFKFRDYYSSLNINNAYPVNLKKNRILSFFEIKKLAHIHNLDSLYNEVINSVMVNFTRNF
jgi:pyruvyltransferase